MPSNPDHVQPRLRRLASKPLQLAASTLRPLTRSGSPSPYNVPTSSSTSSSSSGATLAPTAQPDTVLRKVRSSSFKKNQKHLHTKDALTDGATLTPAQIAAAAKGRRKPLEGEEPAAWLRVRVVSGKELIAKDRNNTSDPFVSLLLPPSTRYATPVVKKSLNPTFPVSGSTFDFPVYMSLGAVVGGRGLEAVVWDKDLMRKEYMGEVTIPLREWFPSGQVELWSENLPLLERKLLSTRRRRDVSGTISLQIGFLEPKNAADKPDALRKVKEVYKTLREKSGDIGRAGVLGVPAHEGIGTVKIRREDRDKPAPLAPTADGVNSHSAFALLHSASAALVAPSRKASDGAMDGDDDDASETESLKDDGLSSSSGSDYESAIEDDEDALSTLHESPSMLEETVQAIHDTSFGIPPKVNGKERDSQPPNTAGLVEGAAKLPKAPARQSSYPGYFEQAVRHDLETPGVSTPGAATPGGTRVRKPIFKRGKSQALSKKPSRKDFNFDASGGDVQGIVVLEIKGATDLPKLKNALRVTFDMDPFVVISFGKKVFRTRVIRHQLNPVWDEKMLFHVKRNETMYTIQFSVLDWDKVSGNDMVGTCTLSLDELMNDAPHPNEETGLYAKNEDGKHEMRSFTLPITTDKTVSWESRHSPQLTVRAKYEPYDALRQRFWRQYIAQYDVDDTGTMSYTELTAMLDSLGSTLTQKTIEGYFSRFNKSSEKQDELTIDQVIQCMESEVTKSRAEKAKIKLNADGLNTGSQTPSMVPFPARDGMDVTGPQEISSPVDPDQLREEILKSIPKDRTDGKDGPGNVQPLAEDAIPSVHLERPASAEGQAETPGIDGIPTPSSGISDTDDPDINDDRERLITIRTCPLCHRRRLKRKSEQDIVTHLAICASNDWARVDRIVTANYVTSSQAQRKFFTRMISKVTIGAYSLGANSANILVQDRITGQLQEEKMAVYVRLGIRVLYKGARSRMEGARARKLLKSLSIKQGLKYDSPESALDIPTFIAFHHLNVEEILDPLDSFKTFNQFFYRKLKPEARPVADPGDEYRLVSCADCRMMAFETVNEATNIWIKGREFSVARLLGPNYKDVVGRFEGGALAIFRLAPQDYHRFHSPVSGKIGKMTMIEGEYYTVNPQAIRTSLDVYGENVRKVVPIHSEEFGLAMTVWVGAMMVGSILTTVEEGQQVKRADELGYFAFGGSTIVCLFEKGVVQWDEDLLANGRASIETLVRMGMGIGRSMKQGLQN